MFQINIVMNLLNSDGSDAFGEVDLDEISASVCDTLRKLRLAVKQLDNEVSDLSNLKRVTLKAIPTIEERRASILRQLDSSAQEGISPSVHLDNHLLQVLTKSHFFDVEATSTSVRQDTSQEEFASTTSSSSQEETQENNNNRCIEALAESVKVAHKSFLKPVPLCKGDSTIVILYSVEASMHFRGRRAGEYSRVLFKMNQHIIKYFQDNEEKVLDDPQVNSACIVKMYTKYQRARIVSLSGEEICAFFVDIGERTFVTREMVLEILIYRSFF